METHMAYANHEINALMTIDPKKAGDEICKALRKAGMHKGNAAKAIGCQHSTLIRWIKKLNLGKRIAVMLKQGEKEGWRYNGRTGRPKGSTKKTRQVAVRSKRIAVPRKRRAATV